MANIRPFIDVVDFFSGGAPPPQTPAATSPPPASPPQFQLNPGLRREGAMSNLWENLRAAGRREKLSNYSNAMENLRTGQMRRETGMLANQLARAQEERLGRQQKFAMQQYNDKRKAAMEGATTDAAINAITQQIPNPLQRIPELRKLGPAGRKEIDRILTNMSKSEEIEYTKDGKTWIKKFGTHPETGEIGLISDVPKKEGPLVQINEGEKDTFDRSLKLRKEFAAIPEVQLWSEISNQADRLDAVVADVAQAENDEDRRRSNIAVDQTLINILNKMLDPESVVRESEYARTQSDLSLLNKIKGRWNKITEGGAGLPDGDRENIIRMARRFASKAQDRYEGKYNRYKGLAEKYDIDPFEVAEEFQRRDFELDVSLGAPETFEDAVQGENTGEVDTSGWSKDDISLIQRYLPKQ